MRDKTLKCIGDNKMKKLLFGTLLLALVIVLPIPTMARVDVSVSISLPPIVFAAPPALIVLPETYVYVVPDSDEDIFFYGGWWWRPWEGRWYRSHYYNSGWGYYQKCSIFLFRCTTRVGGMTTENIVGEDINGTTSEYLSNKFNKTGKAGKETDIGRSKIPGVSRV